MVLEEERKKFIESFKDEKHKYDIKEIPGVLGIYIKTKLHPASKYISLIDVYISSDELAKEADKKMLYISAMYGREAENDGVGFINNKINDPLNFSLNNCFYRISNSKFFIKDKEISGAELLDKIYAAHIKPTKVFGGLFFRFKFFVYRIFLASIFNFLAKAFYYLLFFINGDKYDYEPILKTVKINGRIISSPSGDNYEVEDKSKESAKVDFLGYKINRRIVFSYSIINFIFFITFQYFNIKPVWLKLMLSNNFLMLIYLAISLSLVDYIFPFIFKRIIIKLTNIFAYFKYKNII